MAQKREIISSPVIDDNDDIAIGLSLPFNADGGKLFDLNFLSIDAAVTNVKNLLQTRKGERLNHPDFGTNLLDYIFEPNNSALHEKVGTEIRDAIESWLPYIVIKNLVVRIPNQSEVSIPDRFHVIFVDLTIGLVNNTIDEAEVVIEIKDR